MQTAKLMAFVLLIVSCGLSQDAKVTFFREHRSAFATMYRGDRANSKHRIYADGNRVTTISRGRFITLRLNPGEHSFKAERSEPVVMDLKPGEVVFLRPRFGPSWNPKHLRPPELLEQVSCKDSLDLFSRTSKQMVPVKTKDVFWTGLGLIPALPKVCETEKQ